MSVQSLIDQFTVAQKKAEAANEARYQQLLGIAGDVEKLFGEGYGAGFKTELERAKTRDMASSMQGLVSSGLGGTTRAAGLGKKWEEEIGVPSRLKLEDIIAEKQFGAKQFKAGIIERRTDTYPDYNALMQGISAAYSTPQTTSGGQSDKSGWMFQDIGGYGGGSNVTPAAGQPGMPTYGQTANQTVGQTTGTTTPITMAGGYGPAFQTQAEMNKVLVQPTVTQQQKITSNLQTKYPQMYNANGTLKTIYGGK